MIRASSPAGAASIGTDSATRAAVRCALLNSSQQRTQSATWSSMARDICCLGRPKRVRVQQLDYFFAVNQRSSHFSSGVSADLNFCIPSLIRVFTVPSG